MVKKTSYRDKMLTDEAIIRAELPGHTAKRLSRLASITLRTAKQWLQCGLPRYRRQEVMQLLVQEYCAETRRREARFRQLCEGAGYSYEDLVATDPIARRINAAACRLVESAAFTQEEES